MKFKLIFISIFIICSIFSVYGQTENELGKIATQTTVYIRNGIEIFPEFDKEGQICRAVLQPSRFSSNTVFLGRFLVTGKNIEEILDVLAPQNTRGEKTKFWGFSLLLGQLSATSYNYENIHISLSNSIHFERENSQEELKELEKSVKSRDESIFSSAEVVTIAWTKRQCVEN